MNQPLSYVHPQAKIASNVVIDLIHARETVRRLLGHDFTPVIIEGCLVMWRQRKYAS